MAESAFHNAVVYGLSALAGSCLELKDDYLSSVKAVYEGKDVFVWVPMGFRKSPCYQILPFVFDHKLWKE